MKISIRGPIISNSDQWIYDWFGIDATSPSKVSEQLSQAKSEDIELEINSGGGSVFAASEIYTLLKDHPGKVTGKIMALAASAASVIAMAADDLLMAPTAQMMIHNASMQAQGDYRDMDHSSNFLKNVNQTIANAYQIKSGKSYDELLSMMDAETWLTPQQALEHKLIDEVMFSDPAAQVVASANNGLIPQAVIDKMRNELKNMPENSHTPNNVTPVNQQEQPKNQEEGEKVMNLEEIQNNHPELFNQIKQMGHEEGVAAENSRIKAIDSLKKPQDIKAADFQDIINKAKFESQASAGDTAVELLNKAVQNDQQEKHNYLNNRENDAAALNNVQGGDAPPPANSGADNNQDADFIVSGFQKGGVQ
ncbi:Clp protease ClpP [Bacillus badius]|uniref:head maturation protease, ClpP-related n=1 Tax=Bacillus badius TaxID=1455 RepID=UPI001CBD622C|nr:head maturation protease, ClpP-related [Bacillus badius]UAT29514.1 Clp protease ClpP [Bacillus badius]